MIKTGERVEVMWPNGGGYDVFVASEYGGFSHVESFEVCSDGTFVKDNSAVYAPNAVDDPEFDALCRTMEIN